VFDYIEFFYNSQRKHVRNGLLAPIAFEQQQKLKLQGVKQTGGYSLRQLKANAPKVQDRHHVRVAGIDE
jgi:hypothetical protein